MRKIIFIILGVVAASSVAGAAINGSVEGARTTASTASYEPFSSSERLGLNVKLHPVVLLLGMVSLDVEYQVADQFTLGVVGSYLNREVFGAQFQGNFIGARSTYAFGAASTSGAYLAAQLEKGKLEVSTPDVLGRRAGVTSEPTNLSLLVGYQWFWERFNVNIGAGYLKSDIGDIAIRDIEGKVVQKISIPFPPVTGELALGVTF